MTYRTSGPRGPKGGESSPGGSSERVRDGRALRPGHGLPLLCRQGRAEHPSAGRGRIRRPGGYDRPAVGRLRRRASVRGRCRRGVEAAGYAVDDDRPESEERRVTFEVPGMDCASCAGKVENALSGVVGIRSVDTRPTAGTVVVGYDPDATAPREIGTAIEGAGYPVEGSDAEDERGRVTERLRQPGGQGAARRRRSPGFRERRARGPRRRRRDDRRRDGERDAAVAAPSHSGRADGVISETVVRFIELHRPRAPTRLLVRPVSVPVAVLRFRDRMIPSPETRRAGR